MSPDIGPAAFRICLDLNVWVAALLSKAKGRSDTACQFLVDSVLRGVTGFGPTQLVVSWGMIDRLSQVLTRLGFGREAVETIVAEIALAARIGPVGLSPLLVLGGGMMPLRDVEDAHVLETAIAGKARLIATANFQDFMMYGNRIVEPGRIAVAVRTERDVVIALPSIVAGWMRAGEIPPL